MQMVTVSESALESIKRMGEQQNARIAELEAERDALRANAERYQWLRENNGLWQVQVAIMHKRGDDCNWVHAMDGLDAVIDVARNGKPQ